MKDISCTLPFNGLFIGTHSEIKTCCAGRTDLGNLKDTPIEDILDGKLAREIRNDHLNGVRNINCVDCYGREDIGVKSQRVPLTSIAVQPTDDRYFKLKNIDLRWSNVCNLTCNYCAPFFSSRWAKILGEPILQGLSSSGEATLFEYLVKIKDPDQEYDIILLGGEPLLHGQNIKLLDIFYDSKILVVSNLSLPNVESSPIVQKLIQNTNVNWSVSFENIGEKFEYVRHGASWEIFHKNLNYIHTTTGKTLVVFPIYGVYSAFNLVDLYDFIISSGMFGLVQWQTMTSQNGLEMHSMPDNIKAAGLDELDRCIQKYPDASGIDALRNIRSTLADSMGTGNTAMAKQLIKWSEKLDTIVLSKKRKFSELWPEIIRMINQ